MLSQSTILAMEVEERRYIHSSIAIGLKKVEEETVTDK